jgi:hypothetical protein
VTDDERSVATAPTALSWSSPGTDPLEDIMRAIDNDKKAVARMMGCSPDSLPSGYQSGFNAPYRLVENATGQKVNI